MHEPQNQVKDETVKFRVGYEYTLEGEKHTGEETEASWYLIDQQGGFYSYGPMQPIEPCTVEDKLEFRLKIGIEYLTVPEIEKRLLKGDK
jgi:hypothetical protein